MNLTKWLNADPVNNVVRVYANEFRETPTENTIIADALEFPGPNQKLVGLGSGNTVEGATSDLAFVFDKRDGYEKLLPYVPTLEDWASNPNMNYVVTDKCGCAFGCRDLPSRDDEMWISPIMVTLRFCQLEKTVVEDWAYSLVARPTMTK